MAKKDYQNWDKKALIEEIVSLKRRKKFGLVWEDKPEEVVAKCKKELPVLEEVKSLAISTDEGKPTNLLIEGDNYHALSVLNYTHKGKIDVIYIDPPYNRGGDFMYNDSCVEKEDSFRHSKWLSFLDKRLWLAKSVLHKTGVMFVSIDDNEQAQLRLLLNEIFGEDNVDTMVWRKSGYGRDGKMKNTTTFRKDHEYIMVCYRADKKLNKINEIPEFQHEYKNLDNDPRGSYKAGSISRTEDASNPNHENFYTVVSPSGKEFSRQFDFPIAEFYNLNADVLENPNGIMVGRIYWGKGGDKVPSIKIFLKEERAVTPYSILLTKGTTTGGTKEVSQILGKDCSNMRPKPVKLVETLIQLADKNRKLTVLDFFAGTGTTGHAVLKYGFDKQNVSFILCTNNEKSICSNYCYPRLHKVMKSGYQDKDGNTIIPLGSNLKYFKTTFVPARPTDANKIKLTRKATDMLCIRESTFTLVKSVKAYKIFRNGKRHTGIIYNETAIASFKKAAANIGGKFNVYVFSLADDDFSDLFADMKNKVKLQPIPEVILRVYRRIF